MWKELGQRWGRGNKSAAITLKSEGMTRGGPWRVGVMCVMAARVRFHDVVSPVRFSLFSSALGRELAVVKDRDIPASVSGKEGKRVYAILSFTYALAGFGYVGR